MKINIVTIGRKTARKHGSIETLLTAYSQRIGHYCRFELENFQTEEKFVDSIERNSARNKSVLVLLDSRGRQMKTEEFSHWLQTKRDQSTQPIIFAVGPANGWSVEMRQNAGMLLSLGPMTLPHELAAVVLTEQI